MKKLFLLLALMCATASSSLAQNTAPASSSAGAGVPDIVAGGFTAYIKSGYATAVEFWSKGSSLNLDAPTKTAINKSLSDEENIAGSFIAPEVIKIVNLSSSSILVYISGKYQRGGLYMCFACFKPVDKWLVTSITCDQNPAKILPTEILSGQ